jgi:hypothetical protein
MIRIGGFERATAWPVAATGGSVGARTARLAAANPTTAPAMKIKHAAAASMSVRRDERCPIRVAPT